MDVDFARIDIVAEQFPIVVLFVLFVLAFFIIRSMLKKAIIWPLDEKPEEKANDFPEATLEKKFRQDIALEVSELSTDDLQAVVTLLRSRKRQDED